jgi:hypothetical protein
VPPLWLTTAILRMGEFRFCWIGPVRKVRGAGPFLNYPRP